MDPRFLTTVYGLILFASGLAYESDLDLDEWLPNRDACASERNAAIILYRLLAENKKYDNVALSAVEVLMALDTFSDRFDNETELDLFLKHYRVDENRTTTINDALLLLPPLNQSHNSKITFGVDVAIRHSCRLSNGDTSATDDTNIDDFSEIEDAIVSLENWYRERAVFINFRKAEFGGRECIILLSGGYFGHVWQQSDRCLVRSKYFFIEGMYEPEIRYTRVIDDFPGYGELTELNAKYLEVPTPSNDVNVSLYVILPETMNGLQELKTKMTGETIRKMVNESTRTRVVATLPEFKLTRKYHFLPIIKNVSKINGELFADLVNAVTIDVFPANDDDCISSEEEIGKEDSGLLRFNANHPFLIAMVYTGDGSGYDSLVVGIAEHKMPEQLRCPSI